MTDTNKTIGSTWQTVWGVNQNSQQLANNAADLSHRKIAKPTIRRNLSNRRPIKYDEFSQMLGNVTPELEHLICSQMPTMLRLPNQKNIKQLYITQELVSRIPLLIKETKLPFVKSLVLPASITPKQLACLNNAIEPTYLTLVGDDPFEVAESLAEYAPKLAKKVVDLGLSSTSNADNSNLLGEKLRKIYPKLERLRVKGGANGNLLAKEMATDSKITHLALSGQHMTMQDLSRIIGNPKPGNIKFEYLQVSDIVLPGVENNDGDIFSKLQLTDACRDIKQFFAKIIVPSESKWVSVSCHVPLIPWKGGLVIDGAETKLGLSMQGFMDKTTWNDQLKNKSGFVIAQNSRGKFDRVGGTLGGYWTIPTFKKVFS